MREILVIVDILAAIALVGLVLLQQGKGADMGAAFGSGASQTLFGSRGTANFLTRTTAVLAAVFFGVNLGLAYLSARPTESTSVISPPAVSAPAPAVPPAPEAPQVPEIPK